MAESILKNEDKLSYDSRIYSIYRKETPSTLVSKIISFLQEKYEGSLNIAVDVGCGSGQSTIVFSPFFKKVCGIDSLETQIKEAESSRVLDNIVYKTGPSESLPFDDESVQLISAATSLHWFNLDLFFPEARRILCNNGVLAIYGYWSMKPFLDSEEKHKEIDELYDEYYDALDAYFKPQVKIFLEKYKNINFPFEEVIREPDIRCSFEGHLSDIVGYVKTYSAFKSCLEKDPKRAAEIINRFEERLFEIVASDGKSDESPLTLYRDYILILCRKIA